MKRLLRDNGLSLVLATLFLLFWLGQAVTGFRTHAEDEAEAGHSTPGFLAYLASGHFWQATGENWESEFLQMGAYVLLTTFLFQRGSAESLDPDDPDRDHPPTRASWLRRHSLSLAFGGLFLLSFALHGVGGVADENRQRADRGLPALTLPAFLGSARFWFQSLQNWQSEFLAVLAIVLLSIHLRQHRSPESKPVDAPDSATGN